MTRFPAPRAVSRDQLRGCHRRVTHAFSRNDGKAVVELNAKTYRAMITIGDLNSFLRPPERADDAQTDAAASAVFRTALDPARRKNLFRADEEPAAEWSVLGNTRKPRSIRKNLVEHYEARSEGLR